MELRNFDLLEHLLMENRSGLVIGAQLTAATGHAERDPLFLFFRKMQLARL